MCVRTRISYGCGHVVKIKSDCYSSGCLGVDKHHYEKVGECRECKSQSTNVPRAQESKVRYGQRTKRSNTRVKTNSSSEETLPAEYDVSGGAGPWAPQIKQEKTWESPHRKQADDAWLSEHDDRLSDLQERLEKVTLSEGRSRSGHTTEIVLAQEKDYDYDSYEHDYDLIPDTPTTKHLLIDVPRHLNDNIEHSHQQQGRQHSYDSLPDSMPSYRSSPKLRPASTFNAVNPYPETAHEYDYYNNVTGYVPTKHYHHYRHHYQGHSKSRSDPHYSRKSYGGDSDYELSAAQPPLQIWYPVSDYSYHPLPRPRHYVEYRRY